MSISACTIGELSRCHVPSRQTQWFYRGPPSPKDYTKLGLLSSFIFGGLVSYSLLLWL